jgi:hypothetical protein
MMGMAMCDCPDIFVSIFVSILVDLIFVSILVLIVVGLQGQEDRERIPCDVKDSKSIGLLPLFCRTFRSPFASTGFGFLVILPGLSR